MPVFLYILMRSSRLTSRSSFAAIAPAATSVASVVVLVRLFNSLGRVGAEKPPRTLILGMRIGDVVGPVVLLTRDSQLRKALKASLQPAPRSGREVGGTSFRSPSQRKGEEG
jgi:hypothetical protein